MSAAANAKRIVIKIGTSTLTYESGKLNLRRTEQLCKVVSDLQNAGREVILVSSGAIGVGMGKLGLKVRPEQTEKKQALAAVGQCELMFMYDKLFGEYNQTVAQVLLTADAIEHPKSRRNIENTFCELIENNIIPIVNENDTVAVDELEGPHFGDNDTLSAIVAELVHAQLLIILTDIDALYDGDPRTNPRAKPIPFVEEITPEILVLAGGAGSARGTGGMLTKVRAAQYAGQKGIPTAVLSGTVPAKLYDFFDGKETGTLFAPAK